MARGPAAAEAERLLEKARLCDSCLGRMVARGPGPARRRGARLRARPHSGACRVCGGLTDSLDELAKAAAAEMGRAQYETFLVGAVLPPSVAERDDSMRARLRARGAEPVKSEITRELAERIARISGKRQDRAEPDLSVVLELRSGRCAVRAKEVVVCGRYAKSERGIPQKRQAGCRSVESVIAAHLASVYGCTQVRAGWSGSEDRDSLVGGRGRPFFARAINPSRMHARLPRSSDLGPVQLSCMRRAGSAPSPARIRCGVTVRASTRAPSLRGLRSLAGAVWVLDGRRRAERAVHSVRFRRGRGGRFTMRIVSDGGIPIKRLVEGGGVEPSASSVLGYACRCEGFDFDDIQVIGRR